MAQILESTSPSNLPHNGLDTFDPDEFSDIYPEEREDDMGETSYHTKLMASLAQALLMFFKNRTDVFVTSNMNLYHVEGNPNKWFAPDILIAFGVPNHDRRVYKLWEEKIFPQVIFEIASGRTWRNDIGEKLNLYEKLGAEEYYLLDAEFSYLTAPILAFHRDNERLLATEIYQDRVLSPRLGLEIVRVGDNFRLFDPEENEFLFTLEEADIALENAGLEIERLKAEIELLKSAK